jgi:hypothetical protein
MLNVDEINNKIKELVSKNEIHEKSIRKLERDMIANDDELQDNLKRIDRFQNCKSLSPKQRALFEERSYCLKKMAIERQEMIDELKSNIKKEIDKNNKEVGELKKKNVDE